jgi:glycosyltransferase involved in cell wall biosynthesis
MVRDFEAGNDIVYGVKVSRKADSFMKRMTAQGFYKFQSSMGVESVYNHADFRLMSRRALDMLSTYKEHNLYLRGLIPLIGLRHTTVDDRIGERFAGKSKYTFGKMMHLAMNGITAFSVRPLFAIYNIGMLFLIIGFLIGIYVVWSLIVGHVVQGWASLMLSVWIVGGFILISMGIVGTYIAQIYTEVKRRPLYHIQEILS